MAKKSTRSNTGESKPTKELPKNLQLVAVEYQGPSLADQIESAFSNPLAYTRLVIWGDHYLSQAGEPNISPDVYLSELKREIECAFTVLQDLSAVMREHGNVSLDERARARSVLTELSRWLIKTVITQRSDGFPEESRDCLTLPPEVIEGITELSTIGKQLRDVWLELGSPLPPGSSLKPLAPVVAEDDFSGIPELDVKSPAWTKSVPGLSKDTQYNYRREGSRSKDNMVGRDRDGRQWRRETPNGHIYYLRASLRIGR